MFKIFTTTLLLIQSTVLLAYSPSLDSLLRNGNNADIGNNTVQANLVISEIDASTKEEVRDEMGILYKHSIKLLIVNEGELQPTLTQINYKGGIFANDALVGYTNTRMTDLKIFSEENENIDAELFYSLLGMVMNNDSKLLLKMFKKINSNIKKNEDLVNTDKFVLLNNYKNYLIAIKAEEVKEETELVNPLKPTTDEEKEKVKVLKSQSFLKHDPAVKRVKVEDEFFWIVDDKNIYLKFDRNHHLREMKMTTELGEIELLLGKFVVYSAQLQFPEFIILKDLAGKVYKITASKLTMFSDTSESHSKRLQRYNKLSIQNKITEPQIKPSFVL